MEVGTSELLKLIARIWVLDDGENAVLWVVLLFGETSMQSLNK